MVELAAKTVKKVNQTRIAILALMTPATLILAPILALILTPIPALIPTPIPTLTAVMMTQTMKRTRMKMRRVLTLWTRS